MTNSRGRAKDRKSQSEGHAAPVSHTLFAIDEKEDPIVHRSLLQRANNGTTNFTDGTASIC